MIFSEGGFLYTFWSALLVSLTFGDALEPETLFFAGFNFSSATRIFFLIPYIV